MSARRLAVGVAAGVLALAAAGCAGQGSSGRSSLASDAASASSPPQTHAASPWPAATHKPTHRATATATPAAKPTHKPTPAAKPTPTHHVVALSTCGAPSNPWGYNFCGRGSLIYQPAAAVCDYFACIASFGDGRGYMVECNDGMYSMSGGRSGACGHHRGEGRAVYSGSGPH